MYHDRTVWHFLWAKNMEAKDIHREMLCCPYGQHFFVHILCFHIFGPQKTHNATLFYCGTCIQGRCHLVTAATSVVMRTTIIVHHNKTR
jgi:hypothetical protein